jgi:hypothetical protein
MLIKDSLSQSSKSREGSRSREGSQEGDVRNYKLPTLDHKYRISGTLILKKTKKKGMLDQVISESNTLVDS